MALLDGVFWDPNKKKHYVHPAHQPAHHAHHAKKPAHPKPKCDPNKLFHDRIDFGHGVHADVYYTKKCKK